MIDYVIRKIKPAEYIVLNDFLYEAIFIPDGVTAPPKEITRRPELQIYIKDFGSKKDDYALVAEVNNTIVGVCWVRIMKDYGNVDDETPSLAISIVKEYRKKGIGLSLTLEMINLLKAEGYKRISLSVQKNNYALRMYEKVGFEIISEKEDEFIMVCNLYK